MTDATAGPHEGAAVTPFPLRPVPPEAGRCPRCHCALEVVRLHVAGWRSLLEGSCPRCGHRYVQDLPAGHGLVYPATLDLATGETLAPPGATWFSQPLLEYWERPDDGKVAIRVERRATSARAILLNCLDPVYGHSVLKLLNASRDRDDDAQAGLIALVPGALAALVPDDVAEVWRVDEPPARSRRYLLELAARVDEELDRFEAVALSLAYPHPHPSTYRLDEHTASIEARREGEPMVVLSLRDDRRWGRTVIEQSRRVRALSRRLRARFPEVAVVAVGVGGRGRLPANVLDLRRARPTPADERAWLARLKAADLVIGVHGSNMLLPSGLAAATIELLPRFRYEAMLQATLLAEDDPLAALAHHRFVPGNDRLSDISAEMVAKLATGMLAERERFAQLMLGPVSGRVAGPAAPLRSGLQPDQTAAVRAARVASHWRALARPPLVLADRRGLRFELESEQEKEQFLLHAGHFEGREIDFLASYLRPGDTVLDVGANIGAFTAALARAVAPDGAVHAFEPHAPSRRRLERTVELNALEGVTVSPLVVGNDRSPVELATYGPGYESWTTTVPRAIDIPGRTLVPTGATRLASTSLDLYCAEHGIERIAVLKIDVEGGEPAVLGGARGLLGRGAVDIVLVEVSDNTLPAGTRSSEVLAGLEESGFRTYVLEGSGLVPFRSTGRLEFANVIAASARARARLGRDQSRTKA